MDNYPSRPAKDTAVVEALMNFMEQKHREESLAKALAVSAATSARAKLAKALAVSLRILAEDGAREAGYMIPQSTASKAYLEKLLAERPVVAGKQFPEAELRELLQLL
jgi:N-acyl-D-aspartate/D-glutamate deacylase